MVGCVEALFALNLPPPCHSSSWSAAAGSSTTRRPLVHTLIIFAGGRSWMKRQAAMYSLCGRSLLQILIIMMKDSPSGGGRQC